MEERNLHNTSQNRLAARNRQKNKVNVDHRRQSHATSEATTATISDKHKTVADV